MKSANRVIERKTSEYKYVCTEIVLRAGRKITMFKASVLKKHKHFLTERDAALFVDKVLINAGKEPLNILKRK